MAESYSERTVIAAMRRVLKLADSYIRVQKQDLLITDGLGLMTWGEIRAHIKAAAALKVRKLAAGDKR